MIKFINSSKETPYLKLKQKYDNAINANQMNIEAVSVSSYSNQLNEVSSRFVNLKYVDNKDFIFFSNYNSPKGMDFINHHQIAALIYWNSINVQIRMKAQIKKTSKKYNQKYFFDRSEKKNALAISSNQSKPIKSYNQVIKNYSWSLENNDLKKCPEYWGGFSFTPYYFEFWEGHELRINKREVYEMANGVWKHSFVQP